VLLIIAEAEHLKYTASWDTRREASVGAKDLFDAGNLSGAIAQLTEDVRSHPRELQSRIFLFELLCFAADFQRAQRQLDAIAQTSGEIKVEMGVLVYRQLLQAELARRAFFTGSAGQPKFLTEPPARAALHIQAVAKVRENQAKDAEDLIHQSSRLRRSLKGQADGKSFEDIRDCDDLLGTFLEVFLQTDYIWLPLENVKQIEIRPPRTLRDLLWCPARIELDRQPLGEVFLPVQYYGSSEHPDDLVKLGRMTEWKTLGEETSLGAGQRMFLIDDDERPLLEIRKIEFLNSSDRKFQ
jgi:type VI secretion system protein ImpE